MDKPILPQKSKLQYTKRGVVCGAEFGTVTGEGTYAIRVEATDRAATLLHALGCTMRYVGPKEDSGRAWYQTDYSDQLDATLIQLVEFAATVRENEPNFGQLELAL